MTLVQPLILRTRRLEIGGLVIAIGSCEHRGQQRRADPLALSRRIDTHERQVPAGLRRMVLVEHVLQFGHPCRAGVAAGAFHEFVTECLSFALANELLARGNPQRHACSRAGRIHLPVRPTCLDEECVEDGGAAAALVIVWNYPAVNPIVEERPAQCSDDLGSLICACACTSITLSAMTWPPFASRRTGILLPLLRIRIMSAAARGRYAGGRSSPKLW